MTQTLDAPTQLATTNGNGSSNSIQRAVHAPPAAYDDGPFANLLDATKFSHLQRVATAFSASTLVPEQYRGNVANCFIALQMAMRMNIEPFMFMQSSYIVHGKPGIEAKLAIALINSSGLFADSLDYEIEGEDPKAQNHRVRAFAIRKTTGKRVNGPWIDWAMVRSEQWDGKAGSKWKTIPGLMFMYRAAMFFGRLHCPERLMGMQTVDELYDATPGVQATQAAVGMSRAENLANRLTQRPVSEHQTFEPAPEALAEANAAQQGSNAEPDVSGAEAEPEAPGFQTWDEFCESMASAAASNQTPEKQMREFISNKVLAAGMKGKERGIGLEMLADWYREFVGSAAK